MLLDKSDLTRTTSVYIKIDCSRHIFEYSYFKCTSFYLIKIYVWCTIAIISRHQQVFYMLLLIENA